jgi:transposase InsO family protein
MLMAIWRRRPSAVRLHHSDRGSQCTSEQFQTLLAQHGVVCSMSRPGDCWDDAATEGFFSSSPRGPWANGPIDGGSSSTSPGLESLRVTGMLKVLMAVFAMNA